MQNFKLSVDISDIYQDIKNKLPKEYSLPFFLVFIEADNPDDACHTFTDRLLHAILTKEDTLENRIWCIKLRTSMRIYKVLNL